MDRVVPAETNIGSACERLAARRPSLFIVVTLDPVAICGESAFAVIDRSRPPAPGPPRTCSPLLPRRTLSNGVAVWIVERHRVPLTGVTLVVRAGSAADPPGKLGAASLTAAMLDEGAGQRSALAIADEIEHLGAALSTASSFDSSTIRLDVPVARLGAALPIVADVALRPKFPAEELDRLRQERLTAILQLRDNPAALAPLAFAQVVYGTTHRYGLPAGGRHADRRAHVFGPAGLSPAYGPTKRS